MDLGISFILLAVGLVVLWKTGDWSVANAVRFALVYRVESFIIGFFIFAVATGLPEITSATVSSLTKVPELSAGNLLGSSFVNLTLQLGIASILARKLPIELTLRSRLLQTSITITFIMAIVFFLKIGTVYLGIALVAIYALSFIWLPKTPEKPFIEEVKEPLKENGFFPRKIEVLIKLAASLVLLILSAWLTVFAAISIAQQLQVPVMFIGGTLIAVGTALPELTLEIHAVRRKEYGLALGDIFGSSLLNITLILGMLILFNAPLSLAIGRIISPFFFIVIPWIFYRLIRKHPFTWCDGIAFILIFVLYIISITVKQLIDGNASSF